MGSILLQVREKAFREMKKDVGMTTAQKSKETRRMESLFCISSQQSNNDSPPVIILSCPGAPVSYSVCMKKQTIPLTVMLSTMPGSSHPACLPTK